MNLERPARMKQSPEFGPPLRALDEPMTASRLAANADVVSQRIAAGAELVAPSAGWLKWILPGLLALGVAGYVWLSDKTAEKPEADPDLPAVSEAEPAAKPEVWAPDTEHLAPTPGQAETPPAQVEPRRKDLRRHTQKTVPAKSDKRPAAHSDLPEQLRLFEKAKRTGASGRYAEALAVLSELLARFPDTPLRPDVHLAELEFLMKSDQNEQAVVLLTRLSEASAHRGRRGELLRFLGDLHRKAGVCTAARQAYQQALENPLRPRDATAVRRGLARCEKR